MKDPVVMRDGQTYERAAIAKALSIREESPITRKPIKIAGPVANYALLNGMDSWVRNFIFPIEVLILTFGVHPTDTTTDLQKRVSFTSGIPVEHLVLVYGGQNLQERKTIEDYNVVRNGRLIQSFRVMAGW